MIWFKFKFENCAQAMAPVIWDSKLLRPIMLTNFLAKQVGTTI